MAEGGEAKLGGNAPDADRGRADAHGVGRLELADDERDEVGGHPDRVREREDLLAALAALGDDARVGDGGERRVDRERDGEHRLERRLVPARERAPRVRRLELRGGQEAGDAALVLVARAVEAAELVVQRAAEGQAQAPGARRRGFRQREPAPLGGLVQGNARADRLAAVVLEAGGLDHQLHRVQHELVDSLAHVERDGLLAAEGQRRKIRLEPDVVPGRNRRTGQTMGIHDVLRTRMSAARVLYRDTASSPTLTPRRRPRSPPAGPSPTSARAA